MERSNLNDLCLFSVYRASLACVAAFGVQAALGLCNDDAIEPRVRDQKPEAGTFYREVLEDIHVQQRGGLKTLANVE